MTTVTMASRLPYKNTETLVNTTICWFVDFLLFAYRAQHNFARIDTRVVQDANLANLEKSRDYATGLNLDWNQYIGFHMMLKKMPQIMWEMQTLNKS